MSQCLNQQLQIVHVFGDRELDEANLPDGLEADKADWTGYRFLRDYEDDLPDPEDLGFCFAFSEDDDEFGRCLWLYAQEYGEIGPLAHLVQKFLHRFRPDECWFVTYASSCSKPRVDSFGGGAVFVTADHIKFEDCWDFVARQAAAFTAARAAKSV